jgi:AAA domain
LADIREGKPVWIVEGENKVEALRERGEIALSGDTGATSKWLPDHAELLRGLPVILWPDSDTPGEDYIANAAAAIRAKDPDADIRVVRPFGPPNGVKGKDVCDWQGDPQALAQLAESAVPYVPRGNGQAHDEAPFIPAHPGVMADARPESVPIVLKVFKANDFAKMEAPEQEWEVPDTIPSSCVTGLCGDGAGGKSLSALQLGVAQTSGTDWFGKLPRKGKCLILSCEDGRNEVHRRIRSITVPMIGRPDFNVEDLVNLEIIDMVGEDSLLACIDGRTHSIIPTSLYGEIVKHLDGFMGPYREGSEEGRILILDTLAKVYGGDENVRMQVTQFIGFLDRLAIKYHVAIILLIHPSLAGIASGTGSSGSTGWHGSVRARMYLTAPDPADTCLSRRGGKMLFHHRSATMRRLILLAAFLILLPIAALAQQWNRPVTIVTTGSTGAVTATMPAVAGVAPPTNYLCGIDVEATGTSVVSPITITGLLGGTFTILQAITASATGVGYTRTFTPCLPASGPNVAIAIATTADATASTVNVWANGFLQ